MSYRVWFMYLLQTKSNYAPRPPKNTIHKIKRLGEGSLQRWIRFLLTNIIVRGFRERLWVNPTPTFPGKLNHIVKLLIQISLGTPPPPLQTIIILAPLPGKTKTCLIHACAATAQNINTHQHILTTMKVCAWTLQWRRL